MASIKKIGLLFLLAIAAMTTQAQSFSFGDLFGQAGKQRQNYLTQIAAYQAFESELKQGYHVIKNGLSGIRDINTAELNAHTAYYQSLAIPAPAVKNNTQVQDIFQWQIAVENSFTQNFTGLTDDELSYIASVKSHLLKACSNDLTDLQNLLATGTFQMTDDERLKRLNKIHTAMLDKYQFSRSFTGSAKLLAAQRQQSASDTQALKNLYGNN